MRVCVCVFEREREIVCVTEREKIDIETFRVMKGQAERLPFKRDSFHFLLTILNWVLLHFLVFPNAR